jgi:hypothetical protein
MRRITAVLVLALFCLLPAVPLWSASNQPDDGCCCGKKGIACCRRAHKSPGPRFEAGVSCQHDCNGCVGGLHFAGAGILPAASTDRTAAVQTILLPRREYRVANSAYLAFLHQRPPPALG